jgi:hypothetical protein
VKAMPEHTRENCKRIADTMANAFDVDDLIDEAREREFQELLRSKGWFEDLWGEWEERIIQYEKMKELRL